MTPARHESHFALPEVPAASHRAKGWRTLPPPPRNVAEREPMLQIFHLALDAMYPKNETIHDCVLQGRVSDDLIPASNDDPSGHEKTSLSVTVVAGIKNV
jgi:hypothetical protein